MIFVEDKFEYFDFLREYKKHTNKIYVRFSDNDKHPMNNRISFIYVQNPENEYVINVNNNDGLGIKFEALKELQNNPKLQIVFNYKAVQQVLPLSNAVDADLTKFIQYGYHDIELDEERILQFYKSRFKTQTFLNDSIPIMKQLELIKKYSEKFPKDYDIKFCTYPILATNAFSYIEKSGLKINTNYKQLFDIENITKDNFVYTEYNLMTSTLRPSNRHGGINFAAIKKDSGDRKAFISRFENGELISCDFQAYHPRLLLDLIYQNFLNSTINVKEYEWINNFYNKNLDFYEWIGKEMKIDHLVDYRTESKNIIFRNLYGGISTELLNIPFFKEVQHLTDAHYDLLQKIGAINTYQFKVRIDRERLEPVTPAKVLNYLIQSYETERNIQLILKIKDKLEAKKSKLILYNYDAFVFDVCIEEKQYLYDEVFPILKGKDGRYPIKITIGKNYDEL